MTKKYEDDIAQSELEKLGIKAKKPKLVYLTQAIHPPTQI